MENADPSREVTPDETQEHDVLREEDVKATDGLDDRVAEEELPGDSSA